MKIATELQKLGLVSVKPRRDGKVFTADVRLTDAGYAALPKAGVLR